eukprot:GEMP01000569.1.p1 GENE.GEMP01000569.1~~GEMP01000569.1.p1  ORF type:complete len:1075 (-),score=230.18 GEMP01000569.1:3171-6395(-)
MWLLGWNSTERPIADISTRIERFRKSRRSVPSKSIPATHAKVEEYTARMAQMQRLLAQRGGSSSSTSAPAADACARNGNVRSGWHCLYLPPATFDSAYEAVTAAKAVSFRARQFDHVFAGWRQRGEAELRFAPVPKEECRAELEKTFGCDDLSNMIPLRLIITFDNHDLALDAVETLVQEFDSRDTMVESLTDRLFTTSHVADPGVHGSRTPMVIANMRIYGVLWSVQISAKHVEDTHDSISNEEELATAHLLHYEVYRLALASSLHLLPANYEGDPSFHKDASGSTALHHMVLRNADKDVQCLLRLSADPWVMDADGRPPLFYAVLLEYTKCAEHLREIMEATKSLDNSPQQFAPVWGLIEFYNDLRKDVIPDDFPSAYKERIRELCKQENYRQIRKLLQFGVPMKLDDPLLRGHIRKLFIRGDHLEAFTIMAILGDDIDVNLSHLALSAEMLTYGLLYVLSPEMFFGMRKLSLAHTSIGSAKFVAKASLSAPTRNAGADPKRSRQAARPKRPTGAFGTADASIDTDHALAATVRDQMGKTLSVGGALVGSSATLDESHLNRTSLTQDTLLDALCVWLHVCTRLTKLDLTGCNLGVSDIRLLSKQFPSEEVALKYLNLNANRFGAQRRAGACLYQLIAKLQSLIYIGVADIGASEDFLTDFYNSHTRHNYSTIVSMQPTAKPKSDSEKSLPLSSPPDSSDRPDSPDSVLSLRKSYATAGSTQMSPVPLQRLTIDLSRNPDLLLQSSAKMHMAHLLGQFRHVKLESVGLQNSSLLELMCDLEGTESLQSLNVNYNTFTSPGAAGSLSAVCRAEFFEMKLMSCGLTGDAIDGVNVKFCPLQSLNLSWNRRFGKRDAGYMGLTRFHQLKRLFLAYCGLTESFLINFADHLSEVSTLETLILTGNPGICSSAEAGTAMASILNKALITSLSWADCRVEPPFLRKVHRGDGSRTVSNLDVSGNATIGEPECYAAFLDVISLLPLKTLHASECALNVDCLQQLPSRTRTLAKVYLDSNPGFGSRGGAMAIVRLFGAQAQAMKFVSVRNCDLPDVAEDILIQVETHGGQVDYRGNPAWRD